MIPRIARSLALLIAIAAIADPSLTVTRRSRPIVSVIPVDWTADATAARVRNQMDDDFVVLDESFGAADATVLVGDRLPPARESLAGAVFVMAPEVPLPSVRIEDVVAPARVSFESATNVEVSMHVLGSAGRTLVLSLMQGSLVAGRTERAIVTDDERVRGRVAFVPSSPEPAHLRIVARFDDGPADAAVDVLVDVVDRPLEILFHDPRPSWMSTFVRRAAERDARFIVASRTITSPGVSVAAGRPPALGDAPSLSRFDAIVIGAPESLAAREVDALERYMRVRGGAVLLLLDRAADGPYQRLAGIAGWSASRYDSGVAVGASVPSQDDVSARTGPGAVPSLRVMDVALPAPLPVAARHIAAAAGAGEAPVVWRSAVGAGRLVVSGALDAWQFRDPEQSGFDAFWRATIADIAAASPPAIDVRIEDPVVSPSGSAAVVVNLRDPALAAPVAGGRWESSVSAVIDGPGGRRALRLWPDGPAGRLRTLIDAPNEAGVYRVMVSDGSAEGGAAFLVLPAPSSATPGQRDQAAAWARASGGAVFEADDLDRVRASVLGAIDPEPRRIPWHPMRSAWWIVPFVLALGVEWWSRRRRGLA